MQMISSLEYLRGHNEMTGVNRPIPCIHKAVERWKSGMVLKGGPFDLLSFPFNVSHTRLVRSEIPFFDLHTQWMLCKRAGRPTTLTLDVVDATEDGGRSWSDIS